MATLAQIGMLQIKAKNLFWLDPEGINDLLRTKDLTVISNERVNWLVDWMHNNQTKRLKNYLSKLPDKK